MFRVQVTTLNGAQLGRDIRAQLIASTRRVADFTIKDLTDRMKLGIDFDDNPQKSNDPDTTRAKQRRGQGSLPLIASGRLADPTKWRIKRRGLMIDILPPFDRENVVDVLEERGYKIIGVSDAAEKFALDELDVIARALRSNLDTYLTAFVL